MSEKLMNTDSKFNKFKSACVENIWLIALLMPLLAVAVFALQSEPDNRHQVNKHHVNKRQVNKQHSVSTVNVSVEITSAELFLIVAKPLSELVLLDVYFDGKKNTYNKAQALASASTDVFNIQAYNEASTTQYVVNAPIDMTLYKEKMGKGS